MKFLKFCTLILFLIAVASLHAGHGAELYNEFKDTGEFYDDEKWQEYVDAIGQRLLQHSNDKDRTYYFFVLDVPTINAFATGDAYIYIHRGLITYLSSEDQLAAVIGHEIGHVARRHHAKRRAATLLGQAAGMTAYYLTGRGEMLEASNAVSQMWISGYGREDELDADRFGAELLARAGYNPMAVIDTISVLKDQELFAKQVRQQTPSYHGLFATHPKNDKRLYEAVAYAQESMPDKSVQPIGDFWEMIDGLHYGMPTTSGTRDENIYYDKSYRLVIEFPIGWQVAKHQAQIYGHARGGSDFASILVTRLTSPENLEPAVFVREVLPFTDEDIVDETEISIDCCEYYLAKRENSDASVTGSYLAIYIRGNEYFVIEGKSGIKGSPVNIKTSIGEVISGIRSLRPDDLNYEDIQKIFVHQAVPGDTYAKLARNSSLNVYDYPEETLRLINGHHPHGEPRAGDNVKVVNVK